MGIPRSYVWDCAKRTQFHPSHGLLTHAGMRRAVHQVGLLQVENLSECSYHTYVGGYTT